MFGLETADGARLAVHRWDGKPAPVAVLAVVHGMGEYGERYAPFARFMADRGVTVYAPDLRGHGRTAESDGAVPGHFADKDGWSLIVGDIGRLIAFIRSEHPGLPVFLFGHSMGSLLSRAFMHRSGCRLAGAIHSAASKPQGALARLGLLLANLEIRRTGPRGYSALLAKLLTGNFNRRISPVRTPFDWLSRDGSEVDNYIADGRIIKSFTAAFYRDMIAGALLAGRKACMAGTPKQLPLLFVSGGQDPLGGYGRGIRKTVRAYGKAGMRDVTLIVYPDARHELFQELERDKTMEDIWRWMSSRITAGNKPDHPPKS
jgi:alpha-beta hydrolase superfamily lysophospholipase